MLKISPFLAIALAVTARAAEQTIAYTDGPIYTAKLDGSGAKKLVQGTSPDISPDGARVAFNTQVEQSVERRIVILDIASRKRTIFNNVPSNNCFSPVWSPDGSQLAFSIYDDNEWHVGLASTDGTGFRYVKKAPPSDHSLFGAAWAADGRSIFCQDLETLYRIDLRGKVLDKWKFSDLFSDTAGMNSGCKLAPSPDGRTLLIDVDMAADIERDGWDGPPPAIWQLDLATGAARQITKADQFIWQPAWINDHEILCKHMPGGVHTIAVYRLDLKTRKLTRVLSRGNDVSVSK